MHVGCCTKIDGLLYVACLNLPLSLVSFFFIIATGEKSNPFSYQQEQGWLQAGDNSIQLPHWQPTELDRQKDQSKMIAFGNLGTRKALSASWNSFTPCLICRDPRLNHVSLGLSDVGGRSTSRNEETPASHNIICSSGMVWLKCVQTVVLYPAKKGG